MSDLTTLTPEQKQRIANWNNFGVEFRDALTLVQLSCSDLENKLNEKPTDELKIVEYESKLSDIAKLLNIEDERRKIVTRKFDVLTGRFIEPINKVNEKIKTYKNDLLTLKKAIADKAAKAKAKTDEEKTIREYFANHITNCTATIRQGINNAITKIFEHALNNIDESGLDAYLQTIKDSPKYQPNVFLTPKPERIPAPGYHSSEEIDLFWTNSHETISVSPDTFRGEFLEALTERFEFYNVSLANKAASIELSKKEAADNAAKIQEQQSNAVISNKMAAMATATVVSSGKSLKKVYKLELEQTDKNTVLLLTCLVSNIDTMLPLIKTKTFFETLKKCAIDMKNKDERFTFTGIEFVEDVKL